MEVGTILVTNNSPWTSLGVIYLIYVIGMGILLAEFFLPGSLLGIIGTITICISIGLAFNYHKPIYGISLIIITLIIIPLMVVMWLKKVSLTTEQRIEDGFVSVDESLEELIGKEGIALTLLRPSGVAKIDGRRIDVTSENKVIEKGTPIKVVKIEGVKVIVVPIGEPKQEEED